MFCYIYHDAFIYIHFYAGLAIFYVWGIQHIILHDRISPISMQYNETSLCKPKFTLK